PSQWRRRLGQYVERTAATQLRPRHTVRNVAPWSLFRFGHTHGVKPFDGEALRFQTGIRSKPMIMSVARLILSAGSEPHGTATARARHTREGQDPPCVFAPSRTPPIPRHKTKRGFSFWPNPAPFFHSFISLLECRFFPGILSVSEV